MGLLDKVKSLLGKNKEPVKDGVDKAADVADDKTGGKHTEKIEDGAEKVKDAVDDLPGDEPS
jgi:uncharacterized protein YjbJ (UPF0337 family)